MTAQEIHDILKSQFGEAILEAKLENVPDPFIKIQTEKIKEVAEFTKSDDRLQFDYLMCLSGVDYKGINT